MDTAGRLTLSPAVLRLLLNALLGGCVLAWAVILATITTLESSGRDPIPAQSLVVILAALAVLTAVALVGRVLMGQREIRASLARVEGRLSGDQDGYAAGYADGLARKPAGHSLRLIRAATKVEDPNC